MREVDAVVKKISAAWADEPRPCDIVLRTDVDIDDCISAFGNLRWDEVSSETVRCYRACARFFSGGALRYFLPSFLTGVTDRTRNRMGCY